MAKPKKDEKAEVEAEVEEAEVEVEEAEAEAEEVDVPRTDEEHEEARAADPVASASYAVSDRDTYLEGLDQEDAGYDLRIKVAQMAGKTDTVAMLKDRKKQVAAEKARVTKSAATVEKRDG